MARRRAIKRNIYKTLETNERAPTFSSQPSERNGVTKLLSSARAIATIAHGDDGLSRQEQCLCCNERANQECHPLTISDREFWAFPDQIGHGRPLPGILLPDLSKGRRSFFERSAPANRRSAAISGFKVLGRVTKDSGPARTA
jgi:hypothetical protein